MAYVEEFKFFDNIPTAIDRELYEHITALMKRAPILSSVHLHSIIDHVFEHVAENYEPQQVRQMVLALRYYNGLSQDAIDEFVVRITHIYDRDELVTHRLEIARTESTNRWVTTEDHSPHPVFPAYGGRPGIWLTEFEPHDNFVSAALLIVTR